MLFIRKLRLAYGGCIGFTNGEYRIALVDFIVALRRTKGRGRRTLRSPPSPSSGLHLIHPGDPLRRGTLAAAVYTNLGSYIPVQVDNPHFDVMFGCLVFGLRSLAFQKISLGFGRLFFIGGGMDCSFLRLRWVLPWSIVELPLTATFLPISWSASPFHQCCRVQKSRKKCARAAETSRKQIFHTG